MQYGIYFNEDDKSLLKPISFGYWDTDKDYYDYQAHKQNKERELNLPPLIFYDQRIDETKVNKRGSCIEMMTYLNARNVYSNIVTEHQNGTQIYFKQSSYNAFKINTLLSPFDKNLYNEGFLGYGIYKPKDYPLFYNYYHDMIKRCYDHKHRIKFPSYIDVTVDPYFLNFQNFCQWCIENWYSVPGKIMSLDKDILIKGNKTYGPDTCIFTPTSINSLFVRNDKRRGNLPIGVTLCPSGTFRVCFKGLYNTFDKVFNNEIDAFYAYKKVKEEKIKSIADLYKEYIPEKLYIAMYNYQVEITD